MRKSSYYVDKSSYPNIFRLSEVSLERNESESSVSVTTSPDVALPDDVDVLPCFSDCRSETHSARSMGSHQTL